MARRRAGRERTRRNKKERSLSFEGSEGSLLGSNEPPLNIDSVLYFVLLWPNSYRGSVGERGLRTRVFSRLVLPDEATEKVFESRGCVWLA